MDCEKTASNPLPPYRRAMHHELSITGFGRQPKTPKLAGARKSEPCKQSRLQKWKGMSHRRLGVEQRQDRGGVPPRSLQSANGASPSSRGQRAGTTTRKHCRGPWLVIRVPCRSPTPTTSTCPSEAGTPRRGERPCPIDPTETS